MGRDTGEGTKGQGWRQEFLDGRADSKIPYPGCYKCI